jgi:hypothetical protein
MVWFNPPLRGNSFNKYKEVHLKKLSLIMCLVFLFSFAASVGYADYLFVPARAFHADADDVAYDSYETRIWKDDSTGYLVAPVYLPQGAVVDGVFLFYRDSGTGYISCVFMRTNPDANTYQSQFPITTSGDTGDGHAVSWAVTNGTRTINHAVFAYYLRLYFYVSDDASNYRVYGVRIHYH